MADYTKQTWVDDTGDGASGTVFTKARMDTIEAGVDDAVKHHRIGLASAMPAAAAANKNWLWITTDTDGSGGLYLSDGVTWTKMPNQAGLCGDGADGAWIAPTVPVNVLANPDAEANALTWAAFTSGGGSAGGPTRVADAGAGSGSFAFEVTNTGATGAGVVLLYPGGTASFVGSGALNVVPGQVVDFSGNVKAQGGTFTSIKLTARWLDSGGSLISEVDVTGASQATPTVGTWYSLSGSLSAPAGAAYAGLEVIGSFAGAGTYTMRADNLASRPLMPGTTRSGATYTLTRDVYFTDLTVNAGVTIATNGYRLHCTGTLTNNGTVHTNGGNAAGQVRGVGTGAGTTGSGPTGGQGGALNSAGGVSAGPAATIGGGGNAGAGGAGSAAGGAATNPGGALGGLRRALPDAATMLYADVNGTVARLGGGGGGGGGGGSASGTGGGGGGGGGVCYIAAWIFAGSGAVTANGGNGAQGGTNAGGGGGGGGGYALVLYGKKTYTGTVTASAGTAGAANGTGAAGIAGAAGNTLQLAI